MANKTTEIASREQQGIGHRESSRVPTSLAMMDRFADEMDRVFEDFGFGRRWLTQSFWRHAPHRGLATGLWSPEIEVYQRNNDLVVRADLPGLNKEDVTVDLADNAITISGDRHHEHETEHDGVYRSERTYGTFCRTIALPEGAITEQAKATFKDGVLEITMPAPPQSTRGRRLEIREGEQKK